MPLNSLMKHSFKKTVKYVTNNFWVQNSLDAVAALIGDLLFNQTEQRLKRMWWRIDGRPEKKNKTSWTSVSNNILMEQHKFCDQAWISKFEQGIRQTFSINKCNCTVGSMRTAANYCSTLSPQRLQLGEGDAFRMWPVACLFLHYFISAWKPMPPWWHRRFQKSSMHMHNAWAFKFIKNQLEETLSNYQPYWSLIRIALIVLVDPLHPLFFNLPLNLM